MSDFMANNVATGNGFSIKVIQKLKVYILYILYSYIIYSRTAKANYCKLHGIVTSLQFIRSSQ